MPGAGKKNIFFPWQESNPSHSVKGFRGINPRTKKLRCGLFHASLTPFPLLCHGIQLFKVCSAVCRIPVPMDSFQPQEAQARLGYPEDIHRWLQTGSIHSVIVWPDAIGIFHYCSNPCTKIFMTISHHLKN